MANRATQIAIAFCLTFGCNSIFGHDIESLAANGSRHSGSATVEVFRTGSKAAALRTFSLLVDGRKVGSLRKKQYLELDLSPGSHSLTVRCSFLCDMPDVSITADFKKDRTYYLTAAPGFDDDHRKMTFISTLGQISQEQATKLVSEFKPGKVK
jgi:hypothetical protein